MGKAKFSKLEIILIVLFCLAVAVACVLIGILATKEETIVNSGDTGNTGKCQFLGKKKNWNFQISLTKIR